MCPRKPQGRGIGNVEPIVSRISRAEEPRGVKRVCTDNPDMAEKMRAHFLAELDQRCVSSPPTSEPRIHEIGLKICKLRGRHVDRLRTKRCDHVFGFELERTPVVEVAMEIPGDPSALL